MPHHHPHSGAPATAFRPPARGPRGTWYFVITVLSFGFLAAVPFWHAARRLGRPAVRRLAFVYTAVDAFLVVLMILTPEPNPDVSSGNPTISTIGGMTAFAVLFIGCLQLRSLRQQVYGVRVAT